MLADQTPAEVYGGLKEGAHIAGYTLERALGHLAWLLQENRWRRVGTGFDDVNAFIGSIRFDDFRIVAEQRKRIAAQIKALQPKASNRAIAKMVGAGKSTVHRDVPSGTDRRAKAEEAQAAAVPSGTLISGAEAAKIVARRTTDIATTQARRADNEQRLGAKIAALPDAKFGVVLADPEWHDEVYSEQTGMNRHASRIYTTSTTEDIKRRPVEGIAADDCVLFLWSTNQHLDIAIDVLRAWGFKYVSHYIWRKPTVGLGYWNRSVHEVLLIGTRGKVPAPALGTQWESVIDAPRGDVHSAKPEIFHDMIEAYFPNVPKIELNRRGPARPGWTAWGNESGDETTAA